VAEHSNKFIVDGLGRELLHREKQAAWSLIHWIVRQGLPSFFIFSSQISIFLDTQTSWKKTFRWQFLGMSSLWDPVFIQVLDRTGTLMLNLSATPSTWSTPRVAKESGRGLGSKIACPRGQCSPSHCEEAYWIPRGQWHEKSPHQPYSPYLAPCDFYLFGNIKIRLTGASFEEPDQLLQAIDAIFQSIKKTH
jgi:hypothetical protein